MRLSQYHPILLYINIIGPVYTYIISLVMNIDYNNYYYTLIPTIENIIFNYYTYT